jgi:putative ABC transport system permease protein
MRRSFSRRRDDDLDDEIRAHISMAIAERIARGESPAVAEGAARREFGNVGHVKEVTRAEWGGRWLEGLAQDLRFGGRSLRRAPGFALVAVATIGLGIGVTTAMFTVLNGILLRPLPFREPDRLVALSYGPPGTLMQRGGRLDDGHFLDVLESSSPFAGLTTFANRQMTLTGVGDAEQRNAAAVTTEFHDVLGVPPALGPGFAARASEPGSPTVILGDALWHARFGADPQIIGRTVTLEGVRRTVVGVMPPGFDFPNDAELWVPLIIRRDPNNSLSRPAIARLRDGVAIEQARAAFATIAERWGGTANDSSGVRPSVIPLKALVVGEVSRPLMILAGAVALVLLIACTNVTNLLLMRMGTRDREIAVRAALGAGRARLIRQLLTESVLLAAGGGVLGILIAIGGVRMLLAIVPPGTMPRTDEIRIDAAVLAFTMAAVALVGIAVGLLPAFQATARDLRESLAENARTHSPRRGRLRSALVVAQMAVALVLLIGAGLLVRSFQRIRGVALGFRPEHALAMTIELPVARYPTPAAMRDMHGRLLDGLARIPGVDAAGAVNWRPFGTMHISGDFQVDGGTVPPGYNAYKPAVSPGYFQAMGITVKRGRPFTRLDDGTALKVVVVSQAIADRFWPGGDPLGGRVALVDRPTAGDWMTVVGVVDDVVQLSVMAGTTPAIYQPLTQVASQFFLGHMNFVIRSTAGPAAIAPLVRGVVREVDPNLAVRTVATMDRVVLASVGDRLFQSRLLGAFSVLALLLAAVGIYGVMAYSVAERRHEIGIRLALGAHAGRVVRMVLGRTLALVIPGVVVGSVCALAVTRVLARLLFEIAPTDPPTFAGVALLLSAVAIGAAFIPARRAARVDPVQALRG